MPSIDIGDLVKGAQERVSFLLSADRTVQELVDILRDTHRIMAKLESAFDRLEARATEIEDRVGDPAMYAKRFDRLEEAVLNIERATLSVEAAIGALPKGLRDRIARERRMQPPGPPPSY